MVSGRLVAGVELGAGLMHVPAATPPDVVWRMVGLGADDAGLVLLGLLVIILCLLPPAEPPGDGR